MKSGQICLMCCIVVLIFISVLFHIIAIATDYWLKSSNKNQINFLNIGLWRACFDGYIHPHATPVKEYKGCHRVESDYYKTIQDWLIPGTYLYTRTKAVNDSN